MPEVEVVFYQEDAETTPVLDWLDAMQRRDARIVVKCMDRIGLLAERGYELHRPLADTLRDGIHELRVRFGNVNYRILYFFHEQRAVLAHGLMKEADVPNREIDLAIQRRNKYVANPAQHTYTVGENHDE